MKAVIIELTPDNADAIGDALLAALLTMIQEATR